MEEGDWISLYYKENAKSTKLEKENEQLRLKLDALEGETPWKDIKDKSELIKRNVELEAQIEKMKCCSNCKNIYDTEKKKCINCTAKNNFCNWELTEIGICMGVSD